jgi:plasmid stabilization system protein ParE
LADFPRLGREVPGAKSPLIRELIFRGYRIIYGLVQPERVSILAVVHGRRDLTQEDLQPWKSG